MSAADVTPVYKERSPITETFNAGAAGAVVGLIVSAVQNSLQRHNAGAMANITALVAGAFAFADASVANYRHREDGWNGAAGGCAAGLVMGAAAGSFPMMAGSCAGVGALVGTFQAAGSSMLNQTGLRPPPPAETPDSSSPLLPATQQRRLNFFKKAEQESA